MFAMKNPNNKYGIDFANSGIDLFSGAEDTVLAFLFLAGDIFWGVFL